MAVAYGGESAEATVEVRADPRFTIAPEDRLTKEQAILRAGKLQETATQAMRGSAPRAARSRPSSARWGRAEEGVGRGGEGSAPGGSTGSAGEDDASPYKEYCAGSLKM